MSDNTSLAASASDTLLNSGPITDAQLLTITSAYEKLKNDYATITAELQLHKAKIVDIKRKLAEATSSAPLPTVQCDSCAAKEVALERPETITLTEEFLIQDDQRFTAVDLLDQQLTTAPGWVIDLVNEVDTLEQQVTGANRRAARLVEKMSKVEKDIRHAHRRMEQLECDVDNAMEQLMDIC